MNDMNIKQLPALFVTAGLLILVIFSVGRASSPIPEDSPYGAAVSEINASNKDVLSPANYSYLPPGTNNQTLRHNGRGWVSSSNLSNDGRNVSLTGNLFLPNTTTDGEGTDLSGVIKVGGSRFLHSYGSENTFLGINAGNFGMVGGGNTAIGTNVLSQNNFGGSNTAVGALSLSETSGGDRNSAFGYRALKKTGGLANSAFGAYVMESNVTGSENTAMGERALYLNVNGSGNTAVGKRSLNVNLGDMNTAVGHHSGLSNNGGSKNTFLGYGAGASSASNLINATAIGYNAQVEQNNTLVLGGTSEDAVKVGIGTAVPRAELDVVGEVRISSVSGDGTGKLLCVKPEGTIGTCSNAPDTSGSCSCN